MDLLKKIEELKHRIDKFEKLAEDLSENILSKQKKLLRKKETKFGML